jgi:osmotically-inducible protein OsmY
MRALRYQPSRLSNRRRGEPKEDLLCTRVGSRVASILGQVPSDDELATRARSILRWKIRYNSVRVVAQNGHVTLSGNVFSYADREAAEQTVRKLTGVVTLTNQIITTEGAALGKCTLVALRRH